MNGGQGELVEKKSRFIATLRPVNTEEEAAAFIEEMKKKYWDAKHNCSAYVIGEHCEITRCSDDGDHSGTAGRPMLEVLLKEELHNTAVVVTRYFGGVLLGTGGLVRAYSHGAKIALDAGEVITMSLCKVVRVRTDYNFYGRLVPLICEEGGIVEDTQFTDSVEVVFRIPEEKVGFFEARLVDVSNGRFSSEVIDEKYCEI